jgi:high-affinity iron transporter
MLLNSALIVLQETLEVALLTSILAALSNRLEYRMTWLLFGLIGGLVPALLYAMNLRSISGWFDYTGQEVVNASIQSTIAVILFLLPWTFFRQHPVNGGQAPNEIRRSRLFGIFAAMSLTLAIAREGSEVFVYLDGFLQQGDKIKTVLVGGGIGFSIGISVGFLLYYSLVGLSRKWGIAASVLLLALFAGNMLSQSSSQLIQADWLPSTAPLWDTSGWVSENSVSGQLLYALIGYEANPTLIQMIAYVAGATLVLLGAVFAIYRSTRSPARK